MKVTLDALWLRVPGGTPMSYAEAKEIALLRLELRACWDRGDREGANMVLTRLWQIVGNDHELAAEARRWSAKLTG
ncbi:MAG: hypothetical protein AB7P03_27430 [Kofleriaceae bacterium]